MSWSDDERENERLLDEWISAEELRGMGAVAYVVGVLAAVVVLGALMVLSTLVGGVW